MKNENELKELKDTYIAARDARKVAHRAYITDCDAYIGTPDAYDDDVTVDTLNAYNAARDTASAAWDAYITERQETDKEIEKMETENRIKELKSDAWDAYLVAANARASRDAAHKAYIDASEVFNTALASSKKSVEDINTYITDCAED